MSTLLILKAASGRPEAPATAVWFYDVLGKLVLVQCMEWNALKVTGNQDRDLEYQLFLS